MIDNLSLLISHGLILIACWRLLSRRDLDQEGAEEAPDYLAAARARRDRSDA